MKLFEGEFKGQRTAYSANCMFIAILTNPKVKYDHEVIGEAIFPDGFGAMDPPGPCAGFGAIVLTDDEEDGKVVIADLKGREDDKGKILIFEIVGEDEADISKGKVSYLSPLAKALIGAKLDEEVTWEKPIGDTRLTIHKIEY